MSAVNATLQPTKTGRLTVQRRQKYMLLENLKKYVISPPDAPFQTHRPFNRHTGAGYVAARDGDYRDAIAKKHPTHLLLVETTGALSPSLARIIERLAAQSREKGAIDHTAYGLERRSPKEFAAHHIAARYRPPSSSLTYSPCATLPRPSNFLCPTSK